VIPLPVVSNNNLGGEKSWQGCIKLSTDNVAAVIGMVLVLKFQ